MRPGRRPLYATVLTSSGLWLASSAMLLFVLMLVIHFGPFEACSSARLEGYPPRIGMWLPTSMEAEELAGSREAWRQAAPREARWYEAESLETLAESELDVVVLPHARRLRAGEVAALERFLSKGGAVVVCGGVGVRDAEGRWVGWEATRRLLGVGAVHPMPREELRLASAQPDLMATGLRQPISVLSEPGLPALADSDAPLRWLRKGGAGEASAAVRLVERGAGRLVWLAVGPEYAADDPARAGMRRVAHAALAWAGRLPHGELRDGPALELELETRRSGPRRVALRIENPRSEPVVGAVVRVHLHRPIRSATLRTTTLFQEGDARLHFEPGGEQVDIELPPIPAEDALAWNLDWSPES